MKCKYEDESGENMKKFTLGILAASLIFLGGCLKQKTDKSKPIIKVNGSAITENMFKETLEQSYTLSGQGEKGEQTDELKNKFIYLIHKNRVINDLITRELIKQQAQKRQLKVEETEIDDVIDNIAKSMGGKERFKASLVLNKIDENTFRKNIKIDLLKKKLVDNLTGGTKITDKEIKEFYEKNKEEKFRHDEEVRASHILISASEAEIINQIKAENTDKELPKEEMEAKVKQRLKKVKEKAKDIYKELKNNPDKFAEYAKQYSEDPASASKGGDLGFFSRKEMVDEFSEAAFSTKPGKLSDIVKTRFGYHIIKVVDRKEKGITPLDEIKPHIERYLEGKKKMESLTRLMDSAKESAKIVYLQEEYDLENINKEYRSLIKDIKEAQQKESQKTEKPETKKEEVKAN